MGSIASCCSSILLMAEKMSLWITCTVLICCLVSTITVVLGIGIGIGYNYCFTDMLTRYKYVPAHYIYSSSPRWPDLSEEDFEEPVDPLVTVAPTTITTISTSAAPTSTLQSAPAPAPKRRNGDTPELVTAHDENIQPSQSTTYAELNDTFNKLRNTVDNATEYVNLTSVETTPTIENDILGMIETTETTAKPAEEDVPKIVIPITGLDLISLLSRLRANGSNYTLQLVGYN